MCCDIRTVINSREHNNANVLSLGRATAQCRAAVRDGPGVAGDPLRRGPSHCSGEQDHGTRT
ncbi:MAG: hypothetical protein ABSG38_19425 [Spirochaetia bacterium]